jgi:uncharacterized membrane protein YkvA (DUF1232 family)
MSWWQVLLGVLAGLALVYAVLLGLLWAYARRHPETVPTREAWRLLPDVVRLVKRLAGDGSLPRGVRVRLVLLLVYLASPIDLVPDVLPVIGYADDAVVVALVLRSVVRAAGPEALTRHWPGSPAGLALVRRLAGLSGAGPA